MNFKNFVPILALLLFGCNENYKNPISTNATTTSIDTSANDYTKILANREKRSTEKDTDTLGLLVRTISFDVTTDNKKDFDDGIIHGASIENPDRDIPHL